MKKQPVFPCIGNKPVDRSMESSQRSRASILTKKHRLAAGLEVKLNKNKDLVLLNQECAQERFSMLELFSK